MCRSSAWRLWCERWEHDLLPDRESAEVVEPIEHGDVEIVARVAVHRVAHERQRLAGTHPAAMGEIWRAAVLDPGALLLLDAALELDPHDGADRLPVGVEQLVGDADLERSTLEDQVPPHHLEVVRLVRVALVL